MQNDNGLQRESHYGLDAVGVGAGRFNSRTDALGLNAVGLGFALLQALAASALEP